eukprot:3212352-Lingulodinium_polyedra.AAC.1
MTGAPVSAVLLWRHNITLPEQYVPPSQPFASEPPRLQRADQSLRRGDPLATDQPDSGAQRH